jgi:hypothetical protein
MLLLERETEKKGSLERETEKRVFFPLFFFFLVFGIC